MKENVGGHTVPATHSTQRFSPGLTGPQVRVKGTVWEKGLSRQLTLRRDSVLASLDPRYELKGQTGGQTVPATHSTQKFSPGLTGPHELKGQNVWGHTVPETHSTHGDSVLASHQDLRLNTLTQNDSKFHHRHSRPEP